MTDELYLLFFIRRTAQLLAAFTGDLAFADIAGELDAAAARLWTLRKLVRHAP